MKKRALLLCESVLVILIEDQCSRILLTVQLLSNRIGWYLSNMLFDQPCNAYRNSPLSQRPHLKATTINWNNKFSSKLRNSPENAAPPSGKIHDHTKVVAGITWKEHTCFLATTFTRLGQKKNGNIGKCSRIRSQRNHKNSAMLENIRKKQRRPYFMLLQRTWATIFKHHLCNGFERPIYRTKSTSPRPLCVAKRESEGNRFVSV